MGQNMFKNQLNSVIFVTIFLVYLTGVQVDAWDTEDFEVFDLVEEVGKNFYQVLGVSQDASQSEIKKAYRRLSLQLHPDHNRDDNAEEIFRQLVAVYEVLKDEIKRPKYDQVLKDGLPDWRQPIFYYRRVRKFGIAELAVILFFILTIGQYIVGWSVYLERKYEMEEVLGSRLKRKDKKLAKKLAKTSSLAAAADGDDHLKSRIREEICQIPKPRCLDLLPFLIIRGLVFSVLAVPTICTGFYSHYRELRARQRRSALEAEAAAAAAAAVAAAAKSSDDSGGEGDDDKSTKSRRRRPAYDIPEYIPSENPASKVVVNSDSGDDDDDDEEEAEVVDVYENRTWFDNDVTALTRAMVKYPVGTVGRWDVIAELLQRRRDDVIRMAKTVNRVSAGAPKPVSDSIQGVPPAAAASSGPSVVEVEPTSALVDRQPDCSSNWTAAQQKALETALATYPKGVEERWDKIGDCVPDKTKDECIVRYKHLVELVKKRRRQMTDDR